MHSASRILPTQIGTEIVAVKNSGKARLDCLTSHSGANLC